MKKIGLILIFGFFLTRLYCTRIGNPGEQYGDHFICTDREETWMDEFVLSSVPEITDDMSRVRLSVYFGRWKKIEDWSYKYNNGQFINPARKEVLVK